MSRITAEPRHFDNNTTMLHAAHTVQQRCNVEGTHRNYPCINIRKIH